MFPPQDHYLFTLRCAQCIFIRLKLWMPETRTQITLQVRQRSNYIKKKKTLNINEVYSTVEYYEKPAFIAKHTDTLSSEITLSV